MVMCVCLHHYVEAGMVQITQTKNSKITIYYNKKYNNTEIKKCNIIMNWLKLVTFSYTNTKILQERENTTFLKTYLR
jgi:hypothetical protein